jgi:hypothetical protein
MYAKNNRGHCATSRKVAGSIHDGVTGIFHWHNPSGRTMVLGLTQLLTEMSTTYISWWVKAAGAYGWQPYNLHVPIVLKSGSLNLLEPSGPVQACNGIVFTDNINLDSNEVHVFNLKCYTHFNTTNIWRILFCWLALFECQQYCDISQKHAKSIHMVQMSKEQYGSSTPSKYWATQLSLHTAHTPKPLSTSTLKYRCSFE